MASIYPLVIFLALFASAGATTSISSSGISEALISACRMTPEPDTCIKYLSMFPGSSTGSMQNITEISVRAASFITKEIQNVISILRTEASFATPVFQKCLSSSTVAIKDIVAIFDELTKAIQERNFADATLLAEDAWSKVVTAEKNCTSNDGQTQIEQLSGYMDELRKIWMVIRAFLRLSRD